MTELQEVSLFSGIGGISLGLERAGVHTALLCEYDKHARTILQRHYPEAVIHNDVTELTADDCRAAGAVPGRTVLTAGWPCQGNSVAGARGGMDDPRSGLWSHVVRLLADFRPAWFIGENVPGLFSVNGGRDFQTVRWDLAKLGYGIAWRILDARNFGVPQRRRRVVIVGRLGDTGAAAAQVLLEPEGVPGDLAAGITPRQGATSAARTSVDGSRIIYVADRTTSLKSAPGGADDNFAQGGRLVAFALRGREAGAVPEIHDDGSTVGSLRAAAGGSSRDFVAATFRKAQKAHDSADCERWQQDELADTLDASGHAARTAHAVVTDTVVRRLTPLECERLQGYPDSWTDGQADSQRYKQLGNSVAVPVFEWVGRRLVAVDNHLQAVA
jgi:DNA (cytosine-5)-methyltransferase 1